MKFFLWIGLIIVSPIIIFGSENQIKVKGYAIMDYYYIAKSTADFHEDYKPKDFRNVYPAFEERSGFQFRRIYLTFNRKIDDQFSTRVRFEMNNETYNSTKLTPTIKDAYLKYSNNWFSCVTGIISSPIFCGPEKFWGYRPLEKSIGDFEGLRSSREFGIVTSANFNTFNSSFVFGNGEGNASEKTGEGSKLYGVTVNWYPGNFYFHTYFDTKTGAEYNSEFTGQLMAGFKNKWFRMGIQYSFQNKVLLESAKRGNVDLYSIPVIVNVFEKISLIGRYSHYIVKSNIDYSHHAYFGAMDFKIHKDISIMPNFMWLNYTYINQKSDDKIYRITLTYKF